MAVFLLVSLQHYIKEGTLKKKTHPCERRDIRHPPDRLESTSHPEIEGSSAAEAA